MQPEQNFRPRWWDAPLEASWALARPEALSEWTRLHALGGQLTDAVAADAIALGHGARTKYPKLTAWEGPLEAVVKDEWVANGPVASPWTRVCVAVRHGWELAGPRPALDPRQRTPIPAARRGR